LALTPGTRVGVYEVTEQIGEGGMGQVYRATDTKLKRRVAVKILPPSLAADADRLVRFQREAEVLASLNHPHIGAIYGLEESEGMTALVMELVEGEDLSRRIARGAIPIDEALPIAKQIAEALEAAHEQGIIHRDLKPANIKVRADGTVKVLDFGLAKATEPAAGSSPSLSMSPTLTTPAMTQAGLILGTAAYMSPEQARGKTVDKRADIWAFGCVVYEMLTGQRPFKGDEISDVLAAVLRQDLDWRLLPAAAPPRLRRLLVRCLERDPRMRLRDIGEARVEIDKAIAGAGDDPGAPQTTTSTTSGEPRGRLPWLAFAVAVMGVAALAVPAMRYLRQTSPPAPPETRAEIVTPPSAQPASFALSPDGRQIVFVASSGGASLLWLRSLATTTALPLAGTENARYPFWAPDSQSVGFFAGDVLKRLDLSGGASRTLAPALGGGSGGTWNADGVIVFGTTGQTDPLMRVSAAGGKAVAMSSLGPLQQGHRGPQFLPDGRRFLFYVRGGSESAGVYLAALDGSGAARLTPSDSNGVYLPAGPGPAEAPRAVGWLLWLRAGSLLAQRLDVDRAALIGEPTTLADGVGVDSLQHSAVTVAATGLVAYRTGGDHRQLTWVDRSGTVRGTVGGSDGNNLRNPWVSPDGRRVTVQRTLQGNGDLWLLDGDRMSRLTFDPAVDDRAVWSPDGTQIVFRSARTGAGDLYQKFTSGVGMEELLLASDQSKLPTSWSSDGRFLLYQITNPQADADLWVVPMAGDRTPSVFLKTPFRETTATFSPDGRWVAYQSNESGRPEIYVRPFVPPSRDASTFASATADKSADKPGRQWQVSTAGGIHPRWRPDGKELYYLSPAGAMMAAPIAVTGSTLDPGAPAVLFPTRIYGGGVDTAQGWQYDVAPDGRFLITTMLDNAAAPITLVQNWNPQTKK
jgi:serine/threonine protein kinase/Tol biopolymer transport system component